MLDEISLFQTPSPTSLSPGEIWFKALSSPRIDTYQQILEKEDFPAAKAIYWLSLAGGFGGMAASLLQTVFNTNLFFGLTATGDSSSISSSAIIWSFLAAVFFAIGVPLITLFNTALIYLPVRILGGNPPFAKLLYAFAVYQAPLGLLICFLGAIPTIGCITLPLSVYWLALGVVALRAACRMDTGKALICSLMPVGMSTIFGACVLSFALISTIEIM